MRRILCWLLPVLALCVASGAQAKTFVYVHDASNETDDDPKIYGFESRGGLLSPLTGSPFDVPDAAVECQGHCQTIDYVKKRKTLVVSGPGGLSSFLVNKDGSLAPVAGSPFGGPGQLVGVASVQVKTRSFVYSPEFATGDVHGFEVGANGALTGLTGSPFDRDLHATAGAIARKRFLFIAEEADDPLPNRLAAFVIGEDGTPTAAPGSPLTLAANHVFNIGADAAGRFVYLADDATKASPAIRVHAVEIDKKTGAPAPLPDSPFATDLPFALATGASVGKGVLAAIALDGVDDDLALFKVKKGALTRLGLGQDTNVNARTHTFGGKFLFVASPTNVVVIAIRKRDGAIDHAPFVPLGASPANPTGIVVINR